MRSANRRLGGLWSLIIALLLIVSGAGMAASISQPSTTKAHTHTSAATGGTALSPVSIAMSGTLSSTKACASGYTRVAPNFCNKDVQAGSTSLTFSTCTSVADPSGDAKAIIFDISLIAVAANVHGNADRANVAAYSNTGCTNLTRQVGLQIWEFVAEAAAPIVGASTVTLIAPIVSGNARLQLYDRAPVGSSAAYIITGYLD
jgi:hypothetical protein